MHCRERLPLPLSHIHFISHTLSLRYWARVPSFCLLNCFHTGPPVVRWCPGFPQLLHTDFCPLSTACHGHGQPNHNCVANTLGITALSLSLSLPSLPPLPSSLPPSVQILVVLSFARLREPKTKGKRLRLP